MMRTHGCGELKQDLVGQTVMLAGWLHRRRDHGGLTFIDLRDRSGLAQVVFHAKTNPDLHALIKSCTPEYVLHVRGMVRQRPLGMENPKLPSGMVEIAADKLVVLNPAATPPFEIDDQTEVSEDVRMQWRYLDLRRPVSQGKLILRHKIIHRMRQSLNDLGFIEVETPILTKSTPEGARDYLVPSRMSPGFFYALPQSPQLFKQLLMVAGLERYFQIARCFRDEDLRADRQPEFTQLDLEMSFVEEEDVLGVIEQLVADIFQAVLGIKLSTPFPRLDYASAQAKYQTDKPNLQTPSCPWAFCWVREFPLFHWNDTERRLDAQHHPFTAPHPDDIELLGKEPARVRAQAYDLVLNGMELGSGSVRIHQASLQRQIFDILGLDEQIVKERFGFLLEAFSFGAPPHAGFAIGIDRLVALMTQASSIREVIAFPKTQKGIDLVTNAPSAVTDAQLKELGIIVANRR